MNKDMMKKNVHARVRLLPTACRLDHNGLELPPIEDEWIVRAVSDEGVEISNPRTSHVRMLGYDHIYKFTTDGSTGGFRRGFLSLHVQLIIQGNEVRILPNARPGEPVRPEMRRVVGPG